jgi:hypothetical protein
MHSEGAQTFRSSIGVFGWAEMCAFLAGRNTRARGSG